MRCLLSTKTRARDACSGFTLIELLVVLAVVSLLVAILLPALSRVRACARLVGCRANLKTLGLAWVDYLADHNGAFFQRPNANYNYGGWRGLNDRADSWPRPLNRYVGLRDPNGATERTARVFFCPADRGGIPGAYRLEKAYRAHGTSYHTNPLLIGWRNYVFSARTRELDKAISERLPGLTLQDVADPHHRVILLGDYGWFYQWSPTPLPKADWQEQLQWHTKPEFHCVTFLDAHVEYRRIDSGLYVGTEYRVQPFSDLDDLARQYQEKSP